MHLKRYQDVECLELSKIELPFFAKQWIASNLNVNDFGMVKVEGLNEVIWDPLDHHRHVWDEYAYALLLQRLEKGEVFLIHGHGSKPLVPMLWPEKANDHNSWLINDSLSHEQRFNVERMLADAKCGKGIWQPIEQPEIGTPEPEPEPEDEREELTVTNPRWEHVDEKRKQDSPDETMEGDIVTLMVDVTGVSDGRHVTFKIFDTAISPPSRIAVTRGKVIGGIGTAEWGVKVPREESELEFKGEVSSVSSERTEIPVAHAFNYIFSF